MKQFYVSVILLTITTSLTAQKVNVGLLGGVAAYSGELTETGFHKKFINPALGVTANYELTEKITLRGGLMYTKINGDDRYSSNPNNVARNLSFESKIIELSALGEYNFYDLAVENASPYVFTGVAAFKFDPYTYNSSNEKIYLRPLGTEGQNLEDYNNKKYSKIQIAIPIGVGLKFTVGDNIRIGLEAGIRKLFTDYLDDVSKSYVDVNDLVHSRGDNTVDLSFRGDELQEEASYPLKGTPRGNAKVKDYYYFAGVHLTYRLGSRWMY